MLKKVHNILKVKVFFKLQLVLLYILAIASTILYSYKYDSLVENIDLKYQSIEESYQASSTTKNNLFKLYITENSYLFDRKISNEVYFNITEKYNHFICSEELDDYIETKRFIKLNLKNKTYDHVSINNKINKEILTLLQNRLIELSEYEIENINELRDSIATDIDFLRKLSFSYFITILVILAFLSIDINKMLRKFKGKKNVVDILIKDKKDSIS